MDQALLYYLLALDILCVTYFLTSVTMSDPQTGALKSRDWTTRHQIQQIATGWTSVGPKNQWLR